MRKRRSNRTRNHYSMLNRLSYRAKGIIPFVKTTRTAISLIQAVKQRKQQRNLGDNLRSRAPKLYRDLPKCATQRERIRRAFFGYLKTQMPLTRVGSSIRKQTKPENRTNHRFDLKPCRR